MSDYTHEQLQVLYDTEKAFREHLVARLTRERDAALEALKLAESWFVPHYDYERERGRRPDAAKHIRQTIQAIETGAIHNDR